MNLRILSILGVFCFFFQFQLLGQEDMESDTASLNQKGRAILQTSEEAKTYKEQVLILQEALNYFLQSKNWEVIVDIKSDLAALNYNLLEYEKFKKETEEIKELLNLHTISDSIFNEAQKILVWHSDMIEDYSTSEELYKDIFEYDLIHSDKGTAAVTACNIGYFYEKSISDFQRATNYYQKSIKLIEESPIKYEDYRAMIYSNLGHCLKEQNQYKLAKVSIYKSLQILKSQEEKDMNIMTQWWNYQNLSALFLKNNELDSCSYYCNKALAILEKDEKSYWDDYQTYQTKAKYFVEAKNYSNALSYLKEGVKRAKSQEDIYRPIDAILELANYFSDRGNYGEALDSLQMGIHLLSPDFKEQDILSKNLPQSFAHKKAALKIIEQKATTLYNQYKVNKNILYLKASLINYNLAVDITNQIRQDFTGENSKFFLAKNVLSFYELAIEVAYTLYQLENDSKYLESAFYFAEQNKSILLTESITENIAKGFGNLPDSLLQIEKEFKLNIVQLERKIYNNKKQNKIDQNLIKSLSDDLFTLKESYSKLIDNIEKDYPKYFKLKHQPSITSIEQLQQNYLNDNSILLEYFVGEKHIFLFVIQKNQSRLHKIEKPTDVLDSFNQFKNIISQAPNSKNYQSNLQSFNKISHSFYELLVQNVLKNEKNKHLIIVPDDFLIYLPFETLLTQKSNKENYNINTQSYLLKDFDISYSFSASLLLITKDVHYQSSKDFVGFAPDFKDPIINITTRDCSQGDLYSLQCSEKEIIDINQVFDGKTFFNTAANKKNFVSILNDYNIIHLATHACVDERNPNFSRIYFTDDFLSNSDLTNMQIEANLAVLSACNTSVGPLMKGDGVSSISKGFIMAGIPSVVTSLWSVDDCSTSKLMVNFYKSLNNGNKKSKALRDAKIAYLQETDNVFSHPYYWAPFLLSGQDVELVRNKPFSNLTWLVGLTLSCISLIFFYYKRSYKKTY